MKATKKVRNKVNITPSVPISCSAKKYFRKLRKFKAFIYWRLLNDKVNDKQVDIISIIYIYI